MKKNQERRLHRKNAKIVKEGGTPMTLSRPIKPDTTVSCFSLLLPLSCSCVLGSCEEGALRGTLRPLRRRTIRVNTVSPNLSILSPTLLLRYTMLTVSI